MTRLKQAWLALCGKLEPEVPSRLLVLPRLGERDATHERQRLYADGWNACIDAVIAKGKRK
jgi:hypothetical protein